MDDNADASHAIFKPPPENWRRPPGRPRTTWMKNVHDDLSLLDLGIHEARDLVQNRPLCRLAWLALLSTLASEENFCGTWFFTGYLLLLSCSVRVLVETKWTAHWQRKSLSVFIVCVMSCWPVSRSPMDVFLQSHCCFSSAPLPLASCGS